MKPSFFISIFLAVLTSVWTWWPKAPTTHEQSAENKQGQLLTAKGENVAPEKIGSLRLVAWDAEAKAPKKFEVALKNGKWAILSRYEYPADGGTRVGNTAGGVLNVPRGPLVTDKADRHAELGVLDPEKEGTANPEGRGKRITLKETGGADLVDLIVGKKDDKVPGVFYVRQAGEDSVYTAAVNVDISTSFKDWVEPDPLKIERANIRSVNVVDYSISDKAEDESSPVKYRATTTLSKPKDSDKWISTQTPAEKQVSKDTVERILDELTGMRLVDIRPFDPTWLEPRGFLLGPEQGIPEPLRVLKVMTNRGAAVLLGKEGCISATSKDGLNYHLFFGGAALSEDEDTSADAKAGKGKEEKKDDKAGTTGKNRYMAIFVSYDEKADEDKPKTEEEKKKKEEEASKSKKKVLSGQEKAEKAMQRFRRFFYVISDPGFKRLRPAPADLFCLIDVDKEKLPGEKVPKEKDVVKALSGLQHFDLKEGDGASPEDGDTVEVHYTGWLEKDGTKFDSSVDRKEPFKFVLGKGAVIKGWDEGVKSMKLGGLRKLVIPPELGYGPQGSPPKIPGEARLIFDVELLKITRKSGEVLTPKEPGKVEAPKLPGDAGMAIPPAIPTPVPDAKAPVPEKKTEPAAKTEPKAPEDAKKTAVEPAKTAAPEPARKTE